MLSDSQMQATLDRIHYAGSGARELATLAALQRAFLLAIPFENLDIHWGRPIQLGADAAFRKIVEERRGGYCYEINGLFAALLSTLGFRVTLLAARMYKDDRPGLEFGHLVLRVDLEQPWLVDAGNGQSFRSPLPLDGSTETEAEGLLFRVRTINGRHYLTERAPNNEPRMRFVFDEVSRAIEDFAAANVFHQTSPDSHFTKHPMCTLALPDGRITMVGRKITRREGGLIEEFETTEDQYADQLQQIFGITAPKPSPA